MKVKENEEQLKNPKQRGIHINHEEKQDISTSFSKTNLSTHLTAQTIDEDQMGVDYDLMS